MPQAYVKKLSEELGMTLEEGEAIWNRAKKSVKDKANYAEITHVFKIMMHERANNKKGKHT